MCPDSGNLLRGKMHPIPLSPPAEPATRNAGSPNATPTPAAPTTMPTTKPTATTSKSPAPLAGLMLGLGAAALVLARMRR